MLADHRAKRLVGHVFDLLIRGDARLLEDVGGKLVGKNEQIADLGPVVRRRLGDLVEPVADLWRVRDGAVARQRPRRGRPDDDRRFRDFAFAVRDRKLHPDRVARIILVFDLGLGERGLLDHRPHHRLRAAVERAVGRELHQFARDLRLRRKAHRRVGMLPVADDAEAFELLALHGEPVLGIGAAFLAERDHRLRVLQVRLLLALGAVVLLLDLPFDRQAVTVPARHVIGIETEHLLRARDDVLEHLVERGADVDVAVRVGRAIVQDELGALLRGGAELLIEPLAVPALEELRLFLRQAGAHREIRLRQEQGLGIIAFGLGHGGAFSRGM